MCGRIVRERTADAALSGFYEFSEVRPRLSFNIAPTQEDLFVRDAGDGGRALVASRWGLLPAWARDRKPAPSMFNARAEGLMERSAFRSLVPSRRCVVPIAGYYEWQQTASAKIPMYIRARHAPMLLLAGLWTQFTDEDSGTVFTSHTIITTAASDAMAHIHNRVPVILAEDAALHWLDATCREPADLLPLLVSCPDDLLEAYPVSTRVNSVRSDGPELIERVDDGR